MRIVLTSDLHYNIARSRKPTLAIAERICRLGGDCLVFVGDSASSCGTASPCDLAILDEVFSLFESFPGARLAVAGNHELWLPAGGLDSLHRYENELAAACVRCGVHYLDAAPFYLGDVAIVGNVGWYDYSFRSDEMGIPLRFYEHKVAPGAAWHFDRHRHLVEGRQDFPRAARNVTCRWMDGERVRLSMGDAEFTRWLAARMRRHLDEAAARSRRIVAAVHHLPFEELVPRSIIPNWAFAAGFLGSALLGETLLAYEPVRHVFCGHSHHGRRCRKEHVDCVSIGSTYREKQYEVLDL